MKKTIFLVIGILLFSVITTFNVVSFADKKIMNFYEYFIDEEWNETYGGSNIDYGYCVRQTTDLGYIITGYTRSYGGSGHNIWLIKTDASGNELWNKTFGGSADDEGQSVQQTSDGGYIISGWTKSYGSGGKDLWLIKTDNQGNEQWNKWFGGTSDDGATSVDQTTDGGYIVAGYTSSYGAGSVDAWLIKTDAYGNTTWTKTHGGYSSDGAYYVEQTEDGGYIFTGWTMSYGPGPLFNTWLVKTDNQGNQQWYKAYGGSDVDEGYSVQQTSDDGYIITGFTASFGAGNYDMQLIKTDSSGNEQWNKTFGGSIRDYGYYTQQTFSGGYIIVGYTNSYSGSDDVFLVKTDSSGNKTWDKLLGGTYSDQGFFVQQTHDGGYILTGFTLSYGSGVHDVWLIKMESDESPPPPLVVDAGGPYQGVVDDIISFNSTVTGGVPPYSYNWNFGDGATSTLENPLHIYSLPGNYTVMLTATDDSGYESSDTTFALITENSPPNTPNITGPTSGRPRVELEYTFSSVDPELNNVFYFVDWGDGSSSNWVGPNASGEQIKIKHKWNSKDTFSIKCKAKDTAGAESDWEIFEVTIPRTKFIDQTFFLRFIKLFLSNIFF